MGGLDARQGFLGEFGFLGTIVLHSPALDLHGEAVQVFLTDQTLHTKVYAHFVQEHREFFSFGDVIGDHVNLAALNERLGVAVDRRLKVLRQRGGRLNHHNPVGEPGATEEQRLEFALDGGGLGGAFYAAGLFYSVV